MIDLNAIFSKADETFRKIIPNYGQVKAKPVNFELPCYTAPEEKGILFKDIDTYKGKDCFAEQGKVYIAYKKDNSYRFRKYYEDNLGKEGQPPPPSEKLNKIHLKYCYEIEREDHSSLKNNLIKTSRIDPKKCYPVLNHKGEEVILPLIVCGACIEELCPTLKKLKIRPPFRINSRGERRWDGRKFNLTRYAELIVKNPELLQNQTEIAELRGENASVGYQKGHQRALKNLLIGINGCICSECGVGLKGHETLLTIHHKDSNKANNTVENCTLLCLLCHYENKHGEEVPETSKDTILKLRKKQGISAP